MSGEREALVQVNDLKKYFPVQRGLLGRGKMVLKAVDGVSFSVAKGATFGLVGESGSGKTTTAKTMLRLLDPSGGEVYFEGENILSLGKDDLRALRRRMQYIFQNPYLALNPRMRIGEIVTEPIRIHGMIESADIRDRSMELLEDVGITPAEQFVDRYPRALSGGQRQRVMIARVLSLNPTFIVADEPVSSLDVSVRSQILNLMQDLKERYGLTYLLITHDLSLVEYMSDKTAVMYLGRIVELGKTEEVLTSPLHPYTQMLIAAVPVPDPSVIKEILRPTGETPSALNLPKGCRFLSRCPCAMERCSMEDPQLVEVRPGHYASCFLNEGR